MRSACLLAARVERGEPLAHQRVRLARTRLVSADGGDEVAPVQRIKPERCACTHGGRAHGVVEQRDLAEAVAGPDRADQAAVADHVGVARSEEHTSELQSRQYLVCRLLLEKKNYQP